MKLAINTSSMAKAGMLLISIFFYSSYLFSQADTLKKESSDTLKKKGSIFAQEDIGDWLARVRSKPVPIEKNSFLIIIPWVSSNPTAGFIVGMGLSFAYKKAPSDQ